VTCALVSDLLGHMGAHEPHVLTSEGEILIDRLQGAFTVVVTSPRPTALHAKCSGSVRA
jgi:hypothetical protein